MADVAVEGKIAQPPAQPPVMGVPVAAAGEQDAAGAMQSTSGARGKISGMVTRMKELGTHVVSQMKPWSEMVDVNSFSKPEGFGDAVTRIRKNLGYFKFNYLTVTFVVTAMTFIMDPGSLFVLFGLAAMWFYLLIVRKTPITVNGRQLGQREQFLAASGISLVIVFFLTHVGSELMYALFLSLAIIACHGSFREPDTLFLDEDVESVNLLPIPSSAMASFQNAMSSVSRNSVPAASS